MDFFQSEPTLMANAKMVELKCMPARRCFSLKPLVWCHGDLLGQQPGCHPAEPKKWCSPHAGAAMTIDGKEHPKEVLLSTLEHRGTQG